jgi:hypothetical protein
MVAPEVFEELASSEDALFLGGVDATAIDDGELEPCSARVSMSMLGLIVSQEFISERKSLGRVGELVSSVVLKEVLVGLSGLFCEVPLFGATLPSLQLSLTFLCHIKKLIYYYRIKLKTITYALCTASTV